MADRLSILVTGGAGYLGSILVPELLHQGYRVTVLDNFMYRQNSLTTVCADPNFQVVKGDAREESALKPLIKDADLVVPLAALVGMPRCAGDRIGAIATNRDAIITLLRMLSPSQRIIVPNTNSGYGIGEKGKICTEMSPLRPISLYGRTKVEAEGAVLDRGNAISFRLATVFGMAPRMRLDLLVNDFVYRAVHDRSLVLFEAHFKRNFVHVRDVARAFLHGIASFEAMRDNAYNVGLSDTNISKLELCQRIKRHLPLFVFPEAPVGEDPDRRDYVVSNAKIEATGFRCAYSLDQGIVELIKGHVMIRNSVYGNA
jgi:nucleoside-diphosphate-sugar epimerase